VRVVECVEEGRKSSDHRNRDQAAIKESGQSDETSEPGYAVDVHQDSARGPKRVVDHVGERRQRSPKAKLQPIFAPPGQNAEVLVRQDLIGVTG